MQLQRARARVASWADRAVAWVLARSVASLSVLVAIYVVAVNGIWLVPNIDNHWAISRDLTVNPFGSRTEMLATVDQTRVFALLTWPVVLVLIARAMREPADGTTVLRLSALLAIVGLVPPRPVLWDGQIHSTALPATAACISDALGFTHLMDGYNYPRLAPFRVRW